MEIKLCPKCDGNGKILSNSFDGDNSYCSCDKCNGTGKLKFRVFNIDMPFNYDMTVFKSVEKELEELIKDFNNEQTRR